MKLRVAGVPEPYNLPWHLAMEKRHFRKAGIDLHWHVVHEGTGRMCQMLRDGELDMAVLVTEGAQRDILNGGPHRIVSGFVESALPWGVHVPASLDLEAGNLRGIPYAISRMGSGSHIMALLHAEQQGWRPLETDLEVVHNMAGAAERMQQGPPVIFLWEQYVTRRWVQAGVMRCVDVVRAPWPGFVITAGTGFLQRHAAVVERALAVLRSEADVLKGGPHPVELVMQNAGFTPAVAQEWLQHVCWKVEPPAPGPLAALNGTLEKLGLLHPRA
ncbi:MAG: ABC transporter substrate-binding protein [Flavobacteriales bacterium]|nr:ABC transporter substrate-binding protein [Flavobacteriales bacterium]